MHYAQSIKILKNLVMAVAGLGVAPTLALTARRHFKTERMGLKIGAATQGPDAYWKWAFLRLI